MYVPAIEVPGKENCECALQGKLGEVHPVVCKCVLRGGGQFLRGRCCRGVRDRVCAQQVPGKETRRDKWRQLLSWGSCDVLLTARWLRNAFIYPLSALPPNLSFASEAGDGSINREHTGKELRAGKLSSHGCLPPLSCCGEELSAAGEAAHAGGEGLCGGLMHSAWIS